MVTKHSFHIPVMGIGYTLDTPLRVSQYGITSVVSLVDDVLMEKMRKFYCRRMDLSYEEIPDSDSDCRARRITSYLNMLNQVTKKRFAALKRSIVDKGTELQRVMRILPPGNILKKRFDYFRDTTVAPEDKIRLLDESLELGAIDVNIMTKVDTPNRENGEVLPAQYNDAHSALRGFALSDLRSSIVLSAGMNTRLYTYLADFDDFYPDAAGKLRKKVILKVSDYRSALIQGKFLAKKGIWVSEFRIESGLNCGGHAFASDGHLMGPILEDFSQKREELIQALGKIYRKALKKKDRLGGLANLPAMKITAQGGVGTPQEHAFLLKRYGLDSVGWGTPFMLVPEAVSTDRDTLDRLVASREEDLYLSDVSPMGVKFNNLRGTPMDTEKERRAAEGNPGSTCPKRYLAFNTEYSERPLCTASRAYIRQKLKDLDQQELSLKEYDRAYAEITEKACLCTGLSAALLKEHGLDSGPEGEVAVCPGPNLAYFNRVYTLDELCSYIYGRENLDVRPDRPDLFSKELDIYITYLATEMEQADLSDAKRSAYFAAFIENLRDGADYCRRLFAELADEADAEAYNTESIDRAEKRLDALSKTLPAA
ncbi:MAG: hypothetical protein ACQEQV_09380 [Fibrobacterota bacterium]